MPRSPRVRHQDEDESRFRARRAWLSQLKEDAVHQLPPGTSPAMRAKLRADVEHALRRHGPDHPALELQDILATLVAEACRQLNEIQDKAKRTGRKSHLMTFARWALVVELTKCPPHLVGAPGSAKRTHTTRAIWADLRANLDRMLSGIEPDDDVRQRVEEHVSQWRIEHDRWWHLRPPSPQQVTKGLQAVKAVVDAVNSTPELRQVADTVMRVVQERLHQRRDPKKPPSSPS